MSSTTASTTSTSSTTAIPFSTKESLKESLATSSKYLNFHLDSNRRQRRDYTFDSFSNATKADIAETITLNLDVPSYTNVNA